MTTHFFRPRVVATATFVALALSSCSTAEVSHTGAQLDLMIFVEADDDSAFFGVGATDVKVDQYGEYSALAVTETGVISDLTGVTVDPEVTEHFDQLVIEKQAIYLTDFLIGSYIDTPLVFDDSQAVRDLYWADTAVKWGDVEYMRSYFDSNSTPKPWVLVDDDRGEWRQNGDPAYTPTPYVAGQPRTKLQNVELSRISYHEVAWNGEQKPLMKYRFLVEYDRDVVLTGGDKATEHTNGHVTISVGWMDGLDGPIVGVGWGRSTSLGHYIQGGTRGLYPTQSASAVAGTTLSVGEGLSVAALDGFSVTSDLARAEERGIQVSSGDEPDAVFSYFEGPAFGDPAAPENEYVFAVYRPTPGREALRPSDTRREAAGEYGEQEFFLPLDGEAHRIVGAGIEDGYVALYPAMFDETYDVVQISIESTAGPAYSAEYWVQKGRGQQVHDQLLDAWSFTPDAADVTGE